MPKLRLLSTDMAVRQHRQ